jgi:hypothetical protein
VELVGFDRSIHLRVSGDSLHGPALDDPYRPIARRPGAVKLPASGLKKSDVLALGSLPARTPAHHVDIKELCEVWLSRFRHQMFYNEDATPRRGGAAQIGQDFDARLIVPVVKDHLEAVCVSLWNLLEHVARHIGTTICYPELPRQEVVWVIKHFRQVNYQAS